MFTELHCADEEGGGHRGGFLAFDDEVQHHLRGSAARSSGPAAGDPQEVANLEAATRGQPPLSAVAEHWGRGQGGWQRGADWWPLGKNVVCGGQEARPTGAEESKF